MRLEKGKKPANWGGTQAFRKLTADEGV